MKIALIIVGSILGLFIIAIIAGIITVHHGLYYSPFKEQQDDYHLMGSPQFKEHIEEINEMITHIRNIPYEDVFIKSFDKTKLHARLYENKKSKKVAILCHGYRGTGCRDFSGGGPEFMEMGYNTILIDQRAHGLSKGHSITFGVKESKDVLCWISYAKERFGEDVELVLVGISMGGATVLNLADKVEGNVKIIADCPYASIKALFYKDIIKNKLPIWFFYPLLALTALVYMHINISKFDNYKTVGNAKCPIMIIHGDQDGVVPYEMSYNLYKAYPDKIRYELFPKAEHGIAYVIDKERYRKVIREFLAK